MTIKARDGLALPAFLTLPVGAEPKGLPLVLLPRGGPQWADTIVLDDWSAFLANKGYAVLQVNFRGSTGYGQMLMAVGLKRWGLEMHGDEQEFIAAAAGTEQVLAPSRCACVVDHPHGPLQLLRQRVRQRKCLPAAKKAGVVCRHAAVRDLPRNGNADWRVDIAQRDQQFDHRCQHDLGALLARSGSARAPGDPITVQQRGTAVCATHIQRNHLAQLVSPTLRTEAKKSLAPELERIVIGRGN